MYALHAYTIPSTDDVVKISPCNRIQSYNVNVKYVHIATCNK